MNLNEYVEKLTEGCVAQVKREMFSEQIRPMVAKALNESLGEKTETEGGKKKQKVNMDKLVKKLMNNPEFKKKAMAYMTDQDAYDGWTNSLDGKSYDSLDNLSDGSKRRVVSQRLKDKKIDYAPIAYELWPNMSEDAARSWFSKKVDGKKVSFTDEEISKIFSLLNNTIK